MLKREGWPVGKTRVYRLYRLEGLQLRMKVQRRKRIALMRGNLSINLRVIELPSSTLQPNPNGRQLPFGPVSVHLLKERKMSKQATETDEVDQTIRGRLLEACEHKIALHVDAAIEVVDADPAEVDAWAYEAGKEAWEFDPQAPKKLASYPALHTAFMRGFDAVEKHARLQRDVRKEHQA